MTDSSLEGTGDRFVEIDLPGIGTFVVADDGVPVGSAPTFKCADCNRTWPRGSNANPGGGEDRCPECADGGDDG